MQHRQFYLDNICGLLIVHMIFVVHQPLFCKYSNSSIDFALELLSFFMAWFFFKAGMMFRERPLKEVIRFSAKRLLVPYMAFLALGFMIQALAQYVRGYNPLALDFLKEQFLHVLYNEGLYPTLACWFLLSLFVVRVAYSVLMSVNLISPPHHAIFYNLHSSPFVDNGLGSLRPVG